ncbi:MAG TPA: hypothetical protein VGX03_23005 [Candidatus Binatia bacterium]|nr:hypothetical protein [Candidatus Binatia bacterium]
MRHPPVVVRAAVTFIVASEVRHDTKAGSSKSMALRVSAAWTDGRSMPPAGRPRQARAGCDGLASLLRVTRQRHRPHWPLVQFLPARAGAILNTVTPSRAPSVAIPQSSR